MRSNQVHQTRRRDKHLHIVPRPKGQSSNHDCIQCRIPKVWYFLSGFPPCKSYITHLSRLGCNVASDFFTIFAHRRTVLSHRRPTTLDNYLTPLKFHSVKGVCRVWRWPGIKGMESWPLKSKSRIFFPRQRHGFTDSRQFLHGRVKPGERKRIYHVVYAEVGFVDYCSIEPPALAASSSACNRLRSL